MAGPMAVSHQMGVRVTHLELNAHTFMPYKDPVAQRAYQAEWRAARRKAWLEANGPCIKCGSWLHLEVDHVDPTKKVSHNVWSWTAEKMAAELAKCQVLCSVCHKHKTRLQRVVMVHGTRTMYEKHGCKCAPCRQAKSTHNKKVRQSRNLRLHKSVAD